MARCGGLWFEPVYLLSEECNACGESLRKHFTDEEWERANPKDVYQCGVSSHREGEKHGN